MSNNIDSLDSNLRDAASAVAQLPRPKAPAGLVQRTLDALAQFKPLHRKPLFLRPITHPLARIAAVAMLMALVQPLTYLDVVDEMGRGIENHVGPRVVDHVETIVDGVLTRLEPETYSQSEQDSNIHNVNPNAVKHGKTKLHSRV
ncbi:MAG TPA: hypothetical protein VKX17_15060 [Planctomycetota bacterium]|nr:hypothetical protein [Planctomycetota bacterium]